MLCQYRDGVSSGEFATGQLVSSVIFRVAVSCGGDESVVNTLTDILATSGIVLAVLLAISWRVEGWGARLRVKMAAYVAIIFVLALLGATVGTRDIYGSVRAEVGLILCWMTIVGM